MELEKRYIESTAGRGNFWVITRDNGSSRLDFLFDTKREAGYVLSDIQEGKWNHIIEISEWI